jgi:hypothetical protein
MASRWREHLDVAPPCGHSSGVTSGGGGRRCVNDHPFDTPSQMARRASLNTSNLYAMPIKSSFLNRLDTRKQALARGGSESYLLDIAESRDHVVITIYFKTARCTANESMHLSLPTNPAFDHSKFDRKTRRQGRHLQV